MHVTRAPGWRLAPAAATPESIFRDRRSVLAALGFGAVGAALGRAAVASEAPVGASPPPARNSAFTLDRPLTDEAVAASHNIFDEFAGAKDEVARAAAGFRSSPWKLHVGGLVKQHRTFEVEELIDLFGLEERLYRHRCVETWAMAVPWIGFPLAKLVALCAPVADRTRFVRFVSVARPEEMPGWYASRRVFPYYEALTIEEATHELAFVATGIYGHPLPPQHGAPVRLVLPWKYGFKSAKSIVAVQFTDERPGTFWNDLSPRRFAWSSNVDPNEAEPWPQSHETMIGTGERLATLPFNGYGEWVAKLYA
jgi:sulfoxide reductase catalytic subunit YedY